MYLLNNMNSTHKNLENIFKDLVYTDLVFIQQEQQQSEKNPKTQFSTSHSVIFHQQRIKSRNFVHFLCVLRIKCGMWNILGAQHFWLNDYVSLRQDDINNLK